MGRIARYRMPEWILIPVAAVVLVGLYLLKVRADARRQIGWLRPTHEARIQENTASLLEREVIDWIVGYHASSNYFPTWDEIMEYSRSMDPAQEGVDLPTAMACYRSAKDRMSDDS